MARIHMHDWLILLLLVIIDAVLNIIEPFHRFVGEGMMTDLRYPLKDNTIPFWAVPVCFTSKNYVLKEICTCTEMICYVDPSFQFSEQIIAILLPLAVILVYYFIRKDVYDFHHAILGMFLNLTMFSLHITLIC